jgi:hypothetical protein
MSEDQNNVNQPVASREAKRKASFCEQKEAKKLFYAGPWALSPTEPQAQHKIIFCAAF